jgi:protoporphyrinogen/coproporphyrinogen III oxidase
MAAARVTVVGGGITGLACAWALVERARKARRAIDVRVIERSARLGGNIRTERKAGFVIDAGPDSWIATKPYAEELARSVDLGAHIIGTVAANRRVYIAHEGALHPMPEGLVLGIPTEIGPIVRTSLFSWDQKLRMGLEPLVPARAYAGDDDESVGSFMARRLGDDMTERLVAPLLGGIFAGDAWQISVRAAFPQLVEAERKYGSLVLAMRAQRARAASAAASAGGAAPSMFHSLREGMASLVDALASRLGDRVACGKTVRSVGRSPEHEPHRWSVELENGAIARSDAVVLAGPAHSSARLLASLDPDASSRLGALLGYASSATVFFAFERDDVAHALDASGFIVPRTTGRPLLAGTWVSSKWDHRAPGGHVLMRAFVGGVGFEHVLDRDDADLTRVALSELRRLMAIPGEPVFSVVYRFDRASAQPHVGHLARLRGVREALARHPGIYVAGSGFDGVGIPDCVKQAEAIAETILELIPHRD